MCHTWHFVVLWMLLFFTLTEVCVFAFARRCPKQYFPARVTKANEDGSYDVRFEDGEKELFVDSSLLFTPEEACVLCRCSMTR